MNLRLFALRNAASKKVVDGVFFADKISAKKARDTYNAQATGGVQYVVTPGPDHRRYRSS